MSVLIVAAAAAGDDRDRAAMCSCILGAAAAGIATVGADAQ